MADWTKIRSRGKVVDRRAARGVGAAGGLGAMGFLVVMGLTLLSGGNVDLNQVFTQLEQSQI